MYIILFLYFIVYLLENIFHYDDCLLLAFLYIADAVCMCVCVIT